MHFKACFAIVSQVSLLLPVIVGLVYYQKLSLPFRILFYFLLVCIGFEILAYTTNIIYNNNMPGLHLFTVVEFLALSAVYYLHFSNKRQLQRLILINALVAFVIALADALFINGIMHSNALSRTYACASVIVYTLIYFYQLFRQDTPHSQYDPMFWFAIAALVYFGNNILYFILRRYLLENARAVETISYYTYLSLNIITHFLYAQSFRCFSKWKTES